MSDCDWTKPNAVEVLNTEPVAFVYYFCDGGNFEVRTFTADELPADESEWDEFIENTLQGYYGRSERIRYIWGYNEVPDIPEKPVVATGPKPMPGFLEPEPEEPAPLSRQVGFFTSD